MIVAHIAIFLSTVEKIKAFVLRQNSNQRIRVTVGSLILRVYRLILGAICRNINLCCFNVVGRWLENKAVCD